MLCIVDRPVGGTITSARCVYTGARNIHDVGGICVHYHFISGGGGGGGR